MKPKLIKITTVAGTMNHLFREQLKYMKDYYDIVVISSGGRLFDELCQDLDVKGYAVKMTRKITLYNDLKALLCIILILIKEKPFIVHSHTPKAGILGMMAAWITRVPNRLHTVGGLPLLVHRGRMRIILDFVERMTYYCATKVYPNSFVLKGIIEQNKYTSAEKLKVIANGSSNGVNLSYFDCKNIHQTRKEIRSKLNIDEDDFVFCFAGRVVKDKGINELVAAFVRLYEECKGKIKLLILGDMEKELDPISSSTETNLLNHSGIIYLKFQEDIRPYYYISNVLTFPSYREGFPNVVMQAGAMNLPAIVTDINGCNEIIIQGENGIIIPVKNEFALLEAMRYLINNPQIVKDMSVKARELVASRYDQKMVWKSILNEYQSLESGRI